MHAIFGAQAVVGLPVHAFWSWPTPFKNTGAPSHFIPDRCGAAGGPFNIGFPLGRIDKITAQSALKDGTPIKDRDAPSAS